MSTQNARVKYSPRSQTGQETSITFIHGNNGSAWTPKSISYNKTSDFVLKQATSPPYVFFAISFWSGEGNIESMRSRASRNFTQGQSGDVRFQGNPYVTDVSVAPDQIKFTIQNQFYDGGGVISFQVTIQDGDNDKLFTSVDPQCELEPIR